MRKVKLGDICTIISGTTPKSKIKEYWGGDNVWITPAELDENSFIINDSERHITDLAVTKSGLKSFPKGTVILSSRAPIGKTAIAGCKMYCNQGFKNLICSNAIYNVYLYYYLKSKTLYLNSLGRGATFKEISKRLVEDIEIPLPEKKKQIKIGNTLRAIEILIEKRNKQLLLFEELIKSRFVELFGDPFLNPLHWRIKRIRDIISDIHYGTSKPAVNGGHFKYLRMNNLTNDGRIDLSDLKYIDISDSELPNYLVKKGDVLFNRTNSIDLVGKTSLFNYDENMVIAGYIIRVRLKRNILPEFFTAFMNQPYMKQKLKHIAKGAVNQANINAQELQAILIYEPPLLLQNQFADFVHRIDKSRMAVQKSLDELELLKKSLLQEYFGC